MNFSEWSGVAEIVSAIGVTITLIYLAIQVRQNTRQEEFQSLQSAIQLFLNNFDQATRTKEGAEIFRNGLIRFNDLPASEQAVFHSKMHALLHGFHGVWILHKVGTLPEYELLAMRRILTELILSPGGRQWWNAFKHIPPPHFVIYLEDETQKAEGEISPAIKKYPWLGDDALN